MLNARKLCFAFGSKTILDDVSLTLVAGDRVALVGQNGMGKSTLLSLLARMQAPDSGFIDYASKIKVGVLTQTPQLNNLLSVTETMQQALADHIQAIKNHEELCAQMAIVSDPANQEKLHAKIGELTEYIESKGGFNTEHHIERVLNKLGIKAREQRIETLSGGERRRVDLARLLLSQPTVYLLDEPTNHLDLDAINYLTETFKNSSAAVLFISHDRAFIDELATKIVELDKGKIYTHEPPYVNFVESKLVREMIDERSAHKRERLLVNELAWLRAGTPARTTKQNARIDRAYDLIDQAAKDARDLRVKRVEMQSAQSMRLGSTILEFNDVGISYGERCLFKNFNLNVKAGSRYGILGKNGSGKSSLLGLITKKSLPTTGEIIFGKNTVCLQIDQHREQLNPNATLKETLADYGDYVHMGEQRMHVASYLERYLFSPNDSNRRVSTLSGGEQNRLLLAKQFRQSANCLLLDEPTNDLDVESLGVLEELLLDYTGLVLVISHDRDFLDRICTAMIVFEPSVDGEAESNLVVYEGNYSTYKRLKAESEKALSSIPHLKKEEKDTQREGRTKQKRKRSFNEEREFQSIEATIESLELEREKLSESLHDANLFQKDHVEAQKVMQRLTQLNEEIDTLYMRWQELEDIGA